MKYIQKTPAITQALAAAGIEAHYIPVSQLQIRYRHFELKPAHAAEIAAAVTDELLHWGGIDDVWAAMLPESRDDMKAELAKVIRSKVNQLSRGVA